MLNWACSGGMPFTSIHGHKQAKLSQLKDGDFHTINIQSTILGYYQHPRGIHLKTWEMLIWDSMMEMFLKHTTNLTKKPYSPLYLYWSMVPIGHFFQLNFTNKWRPKYCDYCLMLLPIYLLPWSFFCNCLILGRYNKHMKFIFCFYLLVLHQAN